jgi:hypothetical protein
MINSHPQWPKRAPQSRFGVMPRMRRHLRTTARPSPLRMMLVRAPSVELRSISIHSPVATTFAPDNRSYLTVSPRIQVFLSGPRPQPINVSHDASTDVTALSTLIEETVRTVKRRSTRIERSQYIVRSSRTIDVDHTIAGPGAQPGGLTEPAPRMIPVRVPAPSPQPAPTEPDTFEWKPQATADLAERVIREIDRRVVAERERLGRLP